MKKNSGKGSRLFLIEFLIVLFFFLIISTVCLQLFVKAHLITRRSEALSHAQAAAASVAALFFYYIRFGFSYLHTRKSCLYTQGPHDGKWTGSTF